MAADEGEFSISEYAQQQLGQGNSLEDIYVDLSRQLGKVRRELHGLIDQRYEEFLGLSTSLIGIDQIINQVRKPLSGVSSKIEEVNGELSSTLEFIDARISYRTAIREKKQMLRLFLDISQLMDRVSTILDDANQLNQTDEHIKGLERAAVGFSQLRYFVAKGADHPFVEKQAREQMRALERRLHDSLYKFLVHHIDQYSSSSRDESHSIAMIAQCLRAYGTIDEMEEAESIIRNRMVKPFIEKAFGDLQTNRGMSTDPKVFDSKLEEILGFLQTSAVPLVKGIEKQQHAPDNTAGRLETKVFWQQISSTVISSLPLLFVPGIPDQFHGNYQAACRFICKFSQIFDLSHTQKLLVDDEMFVEFSRKWQLAAYFTIRRKQITGTLEKGGELNEGMLTGEGSSALQGICKCWSPEMYLEPLASKFWQLTLQIILWYQHTVDADIRRLKTATEDNGSDEMLAHIHDIHRLKQFALSLVIDDLPSLLPNRVVSESMQASVNTMFKPLETMADTALRHIGISMIQQCCAGLNGHLRRTTSQYRHTNRQPPTNPSVYVVRLFSKLDEFIQDKQSLSDQAKTILQADVCLGISQEMAKACTEALSTISKTEASLLRLRKSKEYAKMATQQRDDVPVPAGVDLRDQIPQSDNDKIRRQIWLDMVELGKVIRETYKSVPHQEYLEFMEIIAPLGT